MLIKDLNERRTVSGIRVCRRTEDMIRYKLGPLPFIAVFLIISFAILVHFDSIPMLVLGLFMSISGTASLILFKESQKHSKRSNAND